MLKRKIEQKLIDWKNTENRKPLIIKGCRQCGKTFSVLDFAKKNYKNVVYLNFFENPDYASVFAGSLEVDTIVMMLSALLGSEAVFESGSTVLIYTDERCTHAYLFSTPVAADLTLYAGWQRKQPTPVTPVTPVTPAKPSAPADDDLSFSDVSKDSWYYDGVKFVCGKGLMNGTGANRFSPNANTTRGMILTILARIEGVDTSGTPWYAAGQKWAMANGISDGTNMEGEITREQLAAMLYRYAKLKGYDVSASADLSGCSDAAKVNTYAVDAMRWAVAEGLIQGMGGKLNPQSTATRAQVATILMRFLELYSK